MPASDTTEGFLPKQGLQQSGGRHSKGARKRHTPHEGVAVVEDRRHNQRGTKGEEKRDSRSPQKEDKRQLRRQRLPKPEAPEASGAAGIEKANNCTAAPKDASERIEQFKIELLKEENTTEEEPEQEETAAHGIEVGSSHQTISSSSTRNQEATVISVGVAAVAGSKEEQTKENQ